MILHQSATFERKSDGAIAIQCSVCFFSGFSTCHCNNASNSGSSATPTAASASGTAPNAGTSKHNSKSGSNGTSQSNTCVSSNKDKSRTTSRTGPDKGSASRPDSGKNSSDPNRAFPRSDISSSSIQNAKSSSDAHNTLLSKDENFLAAVKWDLPTLRTGEFLENLMPEFLISETQFVSL